MRKYHEPLRSFVGNDNLPHGPATAIPRASLDSFSAKKNEIALRDAPIRDWNVSDQEFGADACVPAGFPLCFAYLQRAKGPIDFSSPGFDNGRDFCANFWLVFVTISISK